MKMFSSNFGARQYTYYIHMLRIPRTCLHQKEQICELYIDFKLEINVIRNISVDCKLNMIIINPITTTAECRKPVYFYYKL